MSTLLIIGYENEKKAEEVRAQLLKLQREYLIDLEDAVIAVRDSNGVQLRQLGNLTLDGIMTSGFWGLLVGAMFWNPFFGLALGAAAGAVTGALADAGIDDGFMKDLAKSLEPGKAALCILVRRSTPDKFVEEIKPFGGKVMRTSLSNEDEEKLKAALAEAASAGHLPPDATLH